MRGGWWGWWDADTHAVHTLVLVWLGRGHNCIIQAFSQKVRKVKRERKSRKSIEKNIFKASDFTACSYTTKLEEQKSPASQSSTQHADKTLKLIPVP